MASISITFEKQGYHVHINGRLIKSFSRFGMAKAIDAAELIRASLIQFGIVSTVDYCEQELTKRRFYKNYNEVYFGEKQNQN